jgi:hypothetical protein
MAFGLLVAAGIYVIALLQYRKSTQRLTHLEIQCEAPLPAWFTADKRKIIGPLAAQLPKLAASEQLTITREYLAKKLPDWAGLTLSQREEIVTAVAQNYGFAAPNGGRRADLQSSNVD